MKFSEQWLREWVNPAISSEELSAQLTMAGLEVDAMAPVAPAFSGIVVGEVVSVVQHPDADKLRVCQVNVGGSELLTIVCGASNVRAGLHVPAAVVGAELPGDFKIKKAKLRGVESFGMLCSAKELGLAEVSEGLLELPLDSPVGVSIRDYLQLDDMTFELGITPNRSDCLSIAGIAREVGVLNKLKVKGPAIDAVAADNADTFPVSVQALADCPRYLGRVIRGVNVKAETPAWMKERLRRSDIRSLGPIVDVTNYVLLELGQPMHAFDLAKLKGDIVVRRAKAGEKIALLNDSEITLDDDTLVIADQNGPLALAGVMGGRDSAVGDTTRDIFLESAFFAPLSLAGRARRYGLHTDSSHRFERGVDPEMARRAIERATALIKAIAGGEAGPVIEVSNSSNLPQRPRITLRHGRIARILGIEIARTEVADILERLGMQIVGNGEGWQVVPPSFRFDITIEEDLVEEVARVYGYNRIPSTHPVGSLAMQARPETAVSRQRLRLALVERGYQETITYSFIEPRLQRLLDPQHEPIALANPISAEMSVMRTSLWPGLVQTLLHNVNRQQERVRIFEQGLKFVMQGTEIRQEIVMGGLVFGGALPEQWGVREQAVDFFDVKSDLEALLALSANPAAFTFIADAHPALHPGQSARLLRDGQPCGWIGALHPEVLRTLDISGNVLVFEVELAAIQQGILPKFSELSKFPTIRRDLALVVESSVTAAQIMETVRNAAPGFLRELKLFDVYQGEHIDSGRKSIALGLTLQEQSRTLTEEDVEGAIQGILKALNTGLGATLRD
ncbi:MAG TPA: phenylalanine--tRNA ligase subunit beta [Gammaproteobacteria bacterium]